MTTRRTETAAMARRICFAQGIVRCPLCLVQLKPADKVTREHMHALGLEGPDDEDNMRYVHRLCADRKTNGTKATSYGSDKHAMAKTKRLRGERKPRMKHNWPSRSLGNNKFKKKIGSGEVVIREQS